LKTPGPFISISTLALAVAVASPAAAHPHVLIDAGLVVVFNDAGDVVSVRHEWLFDPATSAWQTLGLDANGDGTTSEDELAALAQKSVRDIGERRFFTTAGEGTTSVPLASMDDAQMRSVEGRTLLVFGLEPQGPYPIEMSFEIAVYDPEYYIAFTFAEGSVSLENAPPGCGVSIEPPKPLSAELEAQLYSLPPEITKLPPELAAALRGREGAVLVTCEAAP
jgi:ABC-type uncharacterized transport system substrate-binding protein